VHEPQLPADLEVLIDRRRALQLLAGAALVPLVGCGDAGAAERGCAPIPAETAGPFPGPAALATSGVARSDIRSSFGPFRGTADGVPLTLRLTLVDGACAPLAGRAIYVWQCDREARYSLYSAGATEQNYLRGVQETDAAGVVTFTSVFPACYPGRWPHVHFEVYPSLARANAASRLRTSQLALPAEASAAVYRTAGYAASQGPFSRTSLETDGVFRDGASAQVATVAGDATAGYVASLTFAI
jgi:protocatechuate 3,4-dioxygenase beta subunit